MKLSFHGAARTVTGSKHLIHLDSGKKILLDCGLFQGLGRDTMKLNTEWGFDPKEVTCVILSHAHIDHVGLLPKLVHNGFEGKIFCTPPTAQLAAMLMMDSAHIQESDAMHINRKREKEHRPLVHPLYSQEDVRHILPMFHTIPYNEPFRIGGDIELLYTDCGHVLGSAAINLKIHEDGKDIRLTFSGDIGRYNDMILRAPQKFPQADYIIMESTYGNSLHDMIASTADDLLKLIEHTCLEKKGRLVIPAFSVGRTQELLYLLNRLDLEKRLPKINYYVDSPLSIDITNIVKHNPDCFNDAVKKLLEKDDDVFAFDGLKYTKTPEESMELEKSDEPCVIIASSGMAEAGRIKHHIKHTVENRNNTILIVGYCERHSLGGQLKNGAKEVNIFGEEHTVNAEIVAINSLSAHGDYEDLLKWISCQNPDKVTQIFLVHGEYETQGAFKERLRHKGFEHVTIPVMHQEVDLAAINKTMAVN